MTTVADRITELTKRYWANHELSLYDHINLNQQYQPCSDTTRWSEALLAVLFDGQCSLSQGGHSQDVTKVKLFPDADDAEGKFNNNIQPSKCSKCGTKHSPFVKHCDNCGNKLTRMTDAPYNLSIKQYFKNRPDLYAYGTVDWDNLDEPEELSGKIIWKMFRGDDVGLAQEMERLVKNNCKSSNTRATALARFETTTDLVTIDFTLSGNECIIHSINSSNETIKHRLSQSI